jgi:hypothetical protein
MDIQRLHADMRARDRINRDSAKFISYHGLVLHDFGKKLKKNREDDLPMQAHLGSVYMIKGNNILHFYSYCDHAHSLHMQINATRPLWLCKTDIVNVVDGDPEHMRFILEGMEIIYSCDNLNYLLLDLVNNGFSIYIKIS